MPQRLFLFPCFLLAAFALPHASPGQGNAPRQKYGGWEYNKDRGYHYRKFEYKVNPGDAVYRHEYVIYYKQDKQINNKWVYFYNPATEKYWARYPTVNHETHKAGAQAGKELWSVLPQQHRQKDIFQLDLKKFPEPDTKNCPPVPGATDATPIMSPPSDLP